MIDFYKDSLNLCPWPLATLSFWTYGTPLREHRLQGRDVALRETLCTMFKGASRQWHRCSRPGSSHA